MRNRKRAILVLGVLMLTLLPTISGAKDKINVLLWSGQNNHNWEKTTPVLQSTLSQSGLFEVRVTENPGEINAGALSDIDVIVSNWNTFPQMESTWNKAAKTTLMDFIKKGGGIVFIHAASSAHYDWKEFQNMAGATWGMKETHHGKVAPFEVEIKNKEHPITKGVGNFWITDELWVNITQFGTAEILAEAYSPKSNKGRDMMEPVLFAQEIEKGRSVYLVLGHNSKGMQNMGFQTLLLRASEWAASGKVKQKIPAALVSNSQSPKFRFKKSENQVQLVNGKSLLWQYNFDPAQGKPYFHPLNTIKGTCMTGLRPNDHPWHRAVWFSWKFINGVNYWEEDRTTGISEGTTELLKTAYTLDKNKGAYFHLKLSYHPPKAEEVLSEERKIFVSIPSADGSYFMDWESTFTSLAKKVTLDRTPIEGQENGKVWGGYAGFSARLNNQLWQVNATNDKGESGEMHGSTSDWMSLSARNLRGDTVAITIYSHPDNLRAPNSWYVTNTADIPFYYFSAAPLFKESYTLKKGESITLKYRLRIHPNKPTKAFLQQDWNNFKSK